MSVQELRSTSRRRSVQEKIVKVRKLISNSAPNYQPTYQPTNLPTYQPTYQPTSKPSYLPTYPLTYLLTYLPITYQPTHQPIYLPKTYPPTYLPTYMHNYQPTYLAYLPTRTAHTQLHVCGRRCGGLSLSPGPAGQSIIIHRIITTAAIATVC